jgi:tetratricopeptide (TPR) repeat protein
MTPGAARLTRKKTLLFVAAGVACLAAAAAAVFLLLRPSPLERAKELALLAEEKLGEAHRLGLEAEGFEEEGRAELAVARREEASRLRRDSEDLFRRVAVLLHGARDEGLSPDDPGLLSAQGIYLFRRGRYRDAKELLSRAVDLTSGDEAARDRRSRMLVMLATIAERTGDEAGAVEAYRRAIAEDPDNAAAHFNLGPSSRRWGGRRRP